MENKKRRQMQIGRIVKLYDLGVPDVDIAKNVGLPIEKVREVLAYRLAVKKHKNVAE